MRHIGKVLFFGMLSLLTALTVQAAPADRDVIFQTSTLSALQEGVYDGEITLGELKRHGDFGIGTFQGLDGEMIELDRQFYQIKADGKVYRPDDALTTPFAAVTYFEADHKAKIDREMNLTELQSYVESLLPTRNIPYAIMIDGIFTYVKTRSVPKQTKPYPRLVEVTKNQPTFETRSVAGMIVGYWLPAYLGGVNMAGYHLHFLSRDRQFGGHLLECRVSAAAIALDDSFGVNLQLPQQSDFYRTDLSKDNHKELESIEKN